jgi:hypothetical protein
METIITKSKFARKCMVCGKYIPSYEVQMKADVVDTPDWDNPLDFYYAHVPKNENLSKGVKSKNMQSPISNSCP